MSTKGGGDGASSVGYPGQLFCKIHMGLVSSSNLSLAGENLANQIK